MYSGDLLQNIDGLDGRQSFSLQVAAKASTSSANNSVICILRTKDKAPWLTFQMNPFGFVIQQNRPYPIRITSADEKLEQGQLFVATLIQNVADKTMFFYLETREVKYASFNDASDLLDGSANVSARIIDMGINSQLCR